jgi:predicted lipoprotein
MARTAGSWSIIGGLLAVGALQTWGCEDPGDIPTGSAVPDTAAVLRALPENVIVPTLERFREATVALDQTASQWASTGAEADRDVTKVAWSDAMRVWQELEAMQVGPLASTAREPETGQDLRDVVYSWPTVNPCRVDQETVEAEWDSPTFFTDNLVNTRGLDAIEHLLWAGPDNVCPNQIPINSEGSWDALGPAGVTQNRADYTAALAADLRAQADVLLAAWNEHALDAATYGSEQEALNAVYNALFYLETHVQDLKLAEPLGVRTCTVDCLDLVESRNMSRGSNVWLSHNLIGIETLYTGGAGLGLDDLLVLANRADLDTAFKDALADARDAVEGLPGPVDASIVQSENRTVAAFEAIQAAADLLRSDIATVLALQIPNEAAGDND